VSTAAACSQRTAGSIQCQACALNSSPYGCGGRYPSNPPTTTVTQGYPVQLAARMPAMAGSGSSAVILRPLAANARVALPVPAPASSAVIPGPPQCASTASTRGAG
jgi:hypothetical protein